jgi:short-subunit dehydrogenase
LRVSSSTPHVIAITGASGGLGQALVRAYAAPGRHLLLCGRDEGRLALARTIACDAGATVTVLATDLAELDRFTADVAAFDAQTPIDLFIANAGVKVGNVDGIEEPLQLQRVVMINLIASMLAAQTVVRCMQIRGQGHVAFVSSLAARSPNADLLSYSATKSAIEAYAVGLRRSLTGSGIDVSVVLPGFINTPMTDRHNGPTPFMITATDAARRIKSGLDRKRRMIAFPRRLVWLVALRNAFLPAVVSDYVEAWLRAEILPDDDERKVTKR